eukprot:gene7808-4432_t
MGRMSLQPRRDPLGRLPVGVTAAQDEVLHTTRCLGNKERRMRGC